MSALDAEDVRRFAEATERVLELQEKVGAPQIASGNGNLTLHLSGQGQFVYTLLLGFVAGGVLSLAIVVSIWASREFMRSDQQFAKTDQQLFEIRADLKGVRAYINKGAIQPPEKEKGSAK